MTDDDTNLPLPATGPDAPERPGSADPGVLAAIVAGHLLAAAEFGLDAGALTAAAGLTPDALRDPDARIPLERYLALWEHIEALPGGRGFGLWLGGSMRIEMLGVIGYAMQHAPDVAAAVQCHARFAALINDTISPHIEVTADHIVFRRSEPPNIARLSELVVAAPLGTLTLIRQLAGLSPAEAPPVEVAFQHGPRGPEIEARYREAFACPLHFHAPELRLVLPRELIQRRLVHADPGLFAYLARHAERLQDRLGSARTFAARVREQILTSIREGEPQTARSAKLLGCSERTLQRRLRAEGTSFLALVDEVRASLAQLYLEDPTLAVYEVAFLFGYSEPSAFNRAFKRWTGHSPSDHRRGTSTD